MQKLKDDHAKLVAKLQKEVEEARATQTELRRKVKQYRARRESDEQRHSLAIESLRNEKDQIISSFREQSDRATLEVKRLQVVVDAGEKALQEALMSKKETEIKLLKVTKKVSHFDQY